VNGLSEDAFRLCNAESVYKTTIQPFECVIGKSLEIKTGRPSDCVI